MSTYYTLVTNLGLAKIANANALNTNINLSQMAVGDGNGNPTTPTLDQTALVRERYRAAINQLDVDPTNPNYFYADLAIPATEGGWTIREVGLFTNDGTLFAVANFPETYKPQLSEGSGTEFVARIYIEVANTNNITLQIDPTVVLASRQWVTDNYTIAAQIPGGLTGQILRKKTNADGDVEWFDPSGGFSVYVEVLEEHQTLAAGQTVVDLANIGTSGMALYIEGVREFDFTVNSATQFTLGQSYPGGTKIACVQNDPTAQPPDLDARVNRVITDAELVLNTANEAQLTDAIMKLIGNALPPGFMGPFAGGSIPAGWLLCDGTAVSRATYSKLFTAIGTTWGAGDGTTTFNLPDLRGRVPIGVDGDANRITAASTNGANADTLGGTGGAETHTLSINEMPTHSHSYSVTTGAQSVSSGGSANFSTATTLQTGAAGGGLAHSNTQPWAATNFIIKI